MRRKKEPFNPASILNVTSEIRVRFNENDPLGIVWHGNYIKYFEDGREAFGRQHKIGLLDIFKIGFATPIVESSCKHKLTLKYGDVATVVTEFIPTPAAKMIFRYKIFDPSGYLACTGETVQVFLDKAGDLQLAQPQFYVEWIAKNIPE